MFRVIPKKNFPEQLQRSCKSQLFREQNQKKHELEARKWPRAVSQGRAGEVGRSASLTESWWPHRKRGAFVCLPARALSSPMCLVEEVNM